MRVSKIIALGLLASSCFSLVASAAQIEVGQKDKTFTPDAITAAIGTTIRITNDDSTVHNVMITNPDASIHNTGIQKQNETVHITLDKPGEYRVRCGIHPKMKLTVQSH